MIASLPTHQVGKHPRKAEQSEYASVNIEDGVAEEIERFSRLPRHQRCASHSHWLICTLRTQRIGSSLEVRASWVCADCDRFMCPFYVNRTELSGNQVAKCMSPTLLASWKHLFLFVPDVLCQFVHLPFDPFFAFLQNPVTQIRAIFAFTFFRGNKFDESFADVVLWKRAVEIVKEGRSKPSNRADVVFIVFFGEVEGDAGAVVVGKGRWDGRIAVLEDIVVEEKNGEKSN